jgi:Fe2+ transport system protein FeoA
MRIIIIYAIVREISENQSDSDSMAFNGSTLATLKRGQKGIIEAVDAADPQVLRLMVLGLVEGAEVEHASAAIGGDPIEFRLFGNGISLRQEHARFFKVAPVGAGD